ncbi:MAG: hypothetical protein ACXQTS_05205, partial [Candidatus Methanospirareceae archaeon]
AFYYGGDYELLFTMDKRVLGEGSLMKEMKRRAKISIIGRVVPQEEGIWFRRGEEREKMEIRGYQHF